MPSLIGAAVRFGFATVPALGLVLLIEAAVLWWRRKYPLGVLLVVVAGEVATAFITADREPSGAGLAFAVYAVSVYERQRVRLAVAAVAIAMILLAVLVLVLGNFPAARVLIPVGAFSLVAWVIGDYIRSRRTFFRELMERHRKDRELAAEEERLRIARELHDVVAHNVSAMAIQAGAARVSGASSQEALESIERGARDTLAELNKLLGVLRKGPGGRELAPQPTLRDLDALLKPAREAGMDASLRIKGEQRLLPAAVELSAFRIVQEAITNVLKHANASRVEVAIDYQPDILAVTVSDNGSGSEKAASASAGHGLIGMRERVQLFGGDLSTGTSALGGFTVRATLPVKT